MKRERRNHSSEFRAKMALADLAGQFDVHSNQIQDWKKRVVSNAEREFRN